MATMSGLARTEACVASEVLEHVTVAGGVWARHGTAVHQFLDRVAKGMPRSQALAMAPSAHREACEAIDLQAIPHGTRGAWLSEVAFAYNWKTGTARQLDVTDRGYGELEEYEVAGTADLVGAHPDGETIVVLDPKTGWRPLGSPKESLQLLAYAVAAARAFGRTKAIVGFIFIRDGQDPRLEVESISEADLNEAEERIQRIMERAAMVKAGLLKVKPVKGDHCDYCPCIDRCPAHASMLAPFLSNHIDTARGALVGEVQVVNLRPDQLIQAREVAEQVKDMAERMLKDINASIRTLPEGTVVDPRTGRIATEVMVEVEKIDPELARPVLDALFGADLAALAIETKVSVTKAAIGKLIDRRREATKEVKKDLEEAVYERIRAAGGITTGGYTKISIVKPKLPAKTKTPKK